MDNAHSLFDRGKSCLVVIDVQQYFIDKLPLDQRQPIVERISWLMQVAGILEIPIIATAEDIAKVGPLLPELEALLPSDSNVHDKMSFGLSAQPDILTAVKETGRSEFVLVGLETDVCVAQSAIGLIEQGYRVAVIEDGTASPPPHHDLGLRRMAMAGSTISSVKGMYYEWVRDLATDARVRSRWQRDLPRGMTL